MTKRTMNYLKLAVIFLIFLTLVVLAVKTVWTGLNLALYSGDVVEANWYANYYPQARESADEVYLGAQEGRNSFYNSSDMFIRWLSNINNDALQLVVGFVIVLSPYLFIQIVRMYNMNKRKKARV